MIDSHCHLDCIDVSDREGGIQSVLDLARDHGVDRMLCISITLENDARGDWPRPTTLYGHQLGFIHAMRMRSRR